MKTVLSIAGSDPSAGAGIQQDLKTITALGCYGATVITALTSQNTMGVSAVMPVPASVVASQLQAVVDDLDVCAIKIGMIPNREVAEAITETLSPYLAEKPIPVICDPVMVSTSGHRLMAEDCIEYIRHHLFPLCTLITPNLPETEVLTNQRLPLPSDIDRAGQWLVDRYTCAFLLKGGHDETSADTATDRLYCTDGSVHTFSMPRLHSRNLHGTGCTLSSAIAARMAQGDSLPAAVAAAKTFVSDAIQRSAGLAIGHGNGPLILSYHE